MGSVSTKDDWKNDQDFAMLTVRENEYKESK